VNEGATASRHFVAAAATGVLLALSRPPADLGLLAFVALVPLFWSWRGTTPRVAAVLAFVAGGVYYGLLVSWAWYFGAIAVVPFAAVLSLYWAAAGAAVARFARGGQRHPLLIAAIWVLAEALVARWPLGGFSWGEVGYALHDFAPARSLAALGGLPLVSFAVVAVNASLVELFVGARQRARREAWRHARRGNPWRAPAATLAAVVVVSALAGAFALRPTASGHLRIAILQGNNLDRDLTAAEEDARYLPRSHFGLAQQLSGRYDLVIFPESSLDDDPRADSWLETKLVATATRLHAAVLANAVTDAPDGRAVNLNLLYAPDGRLVATYAKRHLVPFGEFVPFRRQLRFISALKAVPRDFAPGSKLGLATVSGHRIATVICFESAFGYQIRPLARAGAEVIVVSTNNRSYRRSANSAQHVAIGQMRAAETGRPVVQAAISGISAVIDAHGRVVERTRLFDRTRVTTRVTVTRGETPYVRFGEWAVVACIIGVGLASVAAATGRKTARLVDSEAVEARA
jgi:apolipoprotein N-acyltransferase